uniref:Uncharacterized protein n=1 Tax=Entomoneis paludosa TaxID=265537 RepID=A0A7S2YKM7_9STRA
MKARTLNPLKLMKQSKRTGKPRFIDDEDTSSASFSIDGSNHLKSSSRTRSLFSVSFDESHNQVHDCAPSQLSPQEIAEELWYSSEECEAMKRSNAFTVKNIRRSAASMGHDSYAQAVNQAYQACTSSISPVTSEQKQALHAQLSLLPTRAGLEDKVLSSKIADKQVRREKLTHLVYNFHTQHPNLTQDTLSVKLARECAKVSAPSQLFAAVIAQARLEQ